MQSGDRLGDHMSGVDSSLLDRVLSWVDLAGTMGLDTAAGEEGVEAAENMIERLHCSQF